jgi:alpha-1,3-mannosyltransferase
MKSYAGIVAVSVSDYEQFSKIRPTGIACIENGANVSKFYDASARDFRKAILSIGRFSVNKRLDRLIDFIQALRRHDPEWTLTIAGRPGDLQAHDVAALAEAAGLRDAVTVVASPTDEAVRALMRTTSFIASASEYEGFGVAAVEGMSAGLFPLLSDIPPFRRLATRTGLGMIISYREPDMDARTLLERLTILQSKHSVHRAACMAAAAVFDWRHVSQEYARVYGAATGRTVRTFADVAVQVLKFDEAVKLIDSRFDQREPFIVAFVNAHTLNVAATQADFRAVLQNCTVLNDGIGIDIASRILYGAPFPENLNGTDFNPNYLQRTRHRYRLFLLGANPGVAERAAIRLSELCPFHRIVGCQHGHFDPDQIAEVVANIRQSEADVVLVAMGNPKQELFLQEHLAATGCTLGIGVGALFDFLAGEVPRAKSWVQKWRLEWIFRLAQEPRRLARRYLYGNPLFLLRVCKQWWSGSRIQSAAPDGADDVALGRSAAAGKTIAL